MKRLSGFLFLALCLAAVAGCEVFGADNDDDGEINYSQIRDIRFSEHVLPLLQQKVAPLLADETGLRLDSWESLIAGSDFGEVLIAFDAENSLLVELATKLDPPHPSQQGEEALTQDEIDFLIRWIDEGARNDAGQAPYEDAEDLLYVCNQDDALISVIDMEANVVIRTVKLADFGFDGAPKPHHIGVEPGGAFWYVSLIGANTVLKFNRDNELVGQTASFATPGMVAVHPTEDLVYAGRSLSAVDPPRSIGAATRSSIGATAPAAVELVEVFFQKPHALRISPDGAYIYTASLVTNQIASVNTATNEVSLSGFPGDPHAYLHFAIAPDSRTLYATGQVSGQLSIFDLSDPEDPALTGTVDVNAGPWHPALTPDGGQLYFGNKGANTVTAFDTQSQAITVIDGAGLAQPHGAATSPDGRFIYISNNNSRGDYTPRYDFGDNAAAGTVVVIDTATNSIVKVLEIEDFPAGMDAVK